MDGDGRPVLDGDGQPVLEDNPYNVVVSVMMLKEGWDVRNVKVIVPLRPCDSRTLTEQTLGRGLRMMHPPILDEDGAASMQKEELYVIEHFFFRSIIDQIHDIVDLKSSDEIEHSREYVPILQKADLTEREAAGVRLVRFEGMREVVPDWRMAAGPCSACSPVAWRPRPTRSMASAWWCSYAMTPTPNTAAATLSSDGTWPALARTAARRKSSFDPTTPISNPCTCGARMGRFE